MRGVVQIVNARSGSFAVSTADGFTVVELLDTVEVEIDDEIAGPLDELGGASLLLVDAGERFEAYVQAVGASEREAREMLA